jgi:transposase
MDVHKKTVVACLRTDAGQETRTFGTMTRELLRLWDWLDQEHVSAVAMESTGVYWKPVFNVLESLEVELMVVNAKHVKAVPGRKTDVKDAEWLADLLRHGLLKASFIPPRPHRELRELARYRRTLIDERSDVVRRIQKLLEGANIKLGDVVTDVVGVSGRAILWALAEGQTDPDQLSQLAKTSLRRKRAELTLALEGSMGDHQRFMLRRQLLHVDFLEGQIEDLCREIEERMRPFQTAYYHALYRRLAARRGPKRAIVAVAHALLTAIYYMLRDGVVHRDLGPDHFDRLNREAVISRNVRRLEKLGYHVSLQPIAS